MKIIGVIPARWASTRFPGKVLADLCGRPLIEHVWHRAKSSKLLSDVIIACDHTEVFKVAENFGARVIMTEPDLPSGTDRIAQAVLDVDCDGVVNIQGDEPLIEPDLIDSLCEVLKSQNADMVTARSVITSDEDFQNPNVVKVVVDSQDNALYFSRSPIPYNRDGKQADAYKHVGIYAYRRNFLNRFSAMPESYLEKSERLEQLRALESGARIKVVLTPHSSCGVDTKEDLLKIQKILSES